MTLACPAWERHALPPARVRTYIRTLIHTCVILQGIHVKQRQHNAYHAHKKAIAQCVHEVKQRQYNAYQAEEKGGSTTHAVIVSSGAPARQPHTRTTPVLHCV